MEISDPRVPHRHRPNAIGDGLQSTAKLLSEPSPGGGGLSHDGAGSAKHHVYGLVSRPERIASGLVIVTIRRSRIGSLRRLPLAINPNLTPIKLLRQLAL